MKLDTAIKYANEISRRVRSVNGLLATPMTEHEAVRISRVWVFGSTVKGSQNPNDLDILIECKPVGRRFGWKQTKLDKRELRSYGFRTAPSSKNEAYKWLTKGMKLVSRHSASENENGFLGKVVMIYPRNDLAAEFPDKQKLFAGVKNPVRHRG